SLHLFDQPGRGGRFTGACRAEQYHISFARINALGEFCNRFRLVTTWLIVTNHLERSDTTSRFHIFERSRGTTNSAAILRGSMVYPRCRYDNGASVVWPPKKCQPSHHHSNTTATRTVRSDIA